MDKRTLAFLVIASPLFGADYAGSVACSGCHKKLYDAYVRTPMGRAATPAAQHLGLAPVRTVVESESLHRRFEVWVEDGKLRQSEEGTGFRSVHDLAYAIGSGENGLSFIVRRGAFLFQAPLSYYSRTKAWALSPGYDFADYGFNRPIAAACIACHSGRPQPVEGRAGEFRDPPFQELAIGCESCHGPGARHIQTKGAKSAIVNPSRLPQPVAEEICMSCHQGGDTRILQPGKTMLDFRPGQRLNDTVAIFRIPRAKDTAGDTDLLEHHESMRLSRCYRQSSGKVNCITCHNPHQAKTSYRETCAGCHPKVRAASHPPLTTDCVPCHMPKREVGFIAHSALTNHRIVRRPTDGLPDVAFSQSSPELPDLVHFNRVQGKPLPLLTLLQAYGELLEKQPAFLPRFNALLDQAGNREPDHPLVLAALGRRSLRAGNAAQAIPLLSKSVARGSEASTTFEDLAEALSRTGRQEEAVKTLLRGLELAPYAQVLHKSLALRYIQLKRYPEAKQTLERYVELFPEDDFVRGLLAKVSGTP